MPDPDKPRRGQRAAGIHPDAPDWCRRLHQLCLDSGLSFVVIAERAGLGSTRNLSRLLAGERPQAALVTVRKVLDVLGRRLGDIDGPTDAPDIEARKNIG